MSDIKTQLLLAGSTPGGDSPARQSFRDRAETDLYQNNPAGFSLPGDMENSSALDYWRLLSRRKGVLIALAVLGGVVGITVSLLQSPVYKARTSVEVQDLNQNFLNAKLVNPVEDSSSLNVPADLQTELQILESESLVERTLDKLHIASPNELNPQTAKTIIWKQSPGPASRVQLIQAAAKALKASVAGQTRILEVSYQSTDPKIAASFANTLVAEFIDQNIQARWQTNRQTSSWLAQQLEELRGNLRRSDDELQAYARKQGLIYTGDKENVSTDKLRQLQVSVSQAQADRVAKESRFQIASTAAPDTLPDVLTDNSLRALQTNINDLRRQEADLAITFKPDYTKARRLRAEIESLQTAFETERGAIVTRITNDYQEAEHREGMLAAAYENQVRMVMADSQKAIQYDILKREVDSNRQIYESMLQRVKESGITSALKASNIRVIDPARIPEKPATPDMPLNGAVGLLGGLMIGIVLVVTRDRVDGSLHQPGDAGRLLGVPELGVIPRGPRTKKLNGVPQSASLVPKHVAGRATTDAQTVAWQDGPSGLADSIRAILASILFARAEGKRKVLVITSAGPDEGKTTTASNLGIALARIGHRVLLIDGDIRKPSLHNVFGLDNTTGVTNLLTQTSPDNSAADAVVRDTDVPNLRVLTSGPALLTGCDMLFSTVMPAVIAHFKERYDTILIDTPPLLHMPDARILGRMSDAVVLIARAGRTLRGAAVAATERLVHDRTPVLGVILNDWNPRSSPDSFYGNYKEAVVKRYYSAAK